MALTDTTPSTGENTERGHDVRTAAQRAADDLDASELHVLMQPEANVQRIMWTGSRWFLGAIGAVAVVLGFLLSSGWRPAVLPFGLQTVFWFSSVIVAASIGLLGWSGCPILEVSVPVADRNKTRTMQLGTALFIIGGALSLFAILLGPSV